ncbi:MAG: 50S ribosomal protein L5 [Candidatus Tagabacteria bacterium RIFCSPLOWO2_01_FULL_42_9]|uniref:Large ribosomal subunit protein uL5 n=1 Tax=Candidatus Tagabacteria bacterium RIFCSPLOWO2_01_FULL_42_9 TaxID=1802296 RepID=A0A1G2LXA6_9BACT|nr:MAG: 50S ribosomal protein L5 [Candidatus Tagabacteria bacterium RIFCSPLOWO2_01_FULL_42_9]
MRFGIMTVKEKYKKIAIPEMKKKFGYKNDMAVPRIIKTVVNTGVGSAKEEKQLEVIEKQLALITGQKPARRLAKKSIASFKLRQGALVGYCATLRGRMMYDFLDRLINVAIPRIGDFRGLNPGAVDKAGNLTIGIKEHTIFPEIEDEEIKFIFGLEATIVTTAKTRDEALELFRLLGFPFSKK